MSLCSSAGAMSVSFQNTTGEDDGSGQGGKGDFFVHERGESLEAMLFVIRGTVDDIRRGKTLTVSAHQILQTSGILF